MCVRLHSPPFYASFFMALYLLSCKFICGTCSAGHLGVLHQKGQSNKNPTNQAESICSFTLNHVTKFQGVKGPG